MRKLIVVAAVLSVGLASCGNNNGKQGRQNDAQAKEDVSLVAPDKNPVMPVKGKLVIGHEVRSFTASGDTVGYWVVDKSGQLEKDYYETVGAGAKPYTPVYAELEVKDMGRSEDGFAADYAGVYEVVNIVKVSKPRE